jgi:membrane protease YdiL (CAAX protease family)
MEANLVGDGVAKPRPTFPYSNWGPWAAILGVLAALAVGVFFAAPALLVGSQEGEIEARFPPSFGTGASFDKGDATALAVDAQGDKLFADHEDEVRVFGAGAEEIPKAAITGLEDSHGLAFDPETGTLIVAEQGPGRITSYLKGGPVAGFAPIEAPRLPGNLAGFEPERLALDPSPAAEHLYAIDAGDDEVLRFDDKGEYRGRLERSGTSTPGHFDLGSGDNDIAVDTAPGPGRGDVFVLSGKGDGTVWAFSPAGKFLWELTPESGDEFAALAVDGEGNLWIAEPEGDIYEYSRLPATHRAPERTGVEIHAGDEVSALLFAGGGHAFVARELDDSLSTLGNVLSQIGTALGFLLVPMALAAMRGARGPREIFGRLGFHAFRPSALKWMGLTVVLYLAFNVFYSAVITEPHQEDIAKGFGTIPIQILLIVIAAPVTEEVCFRGMLFGGLREKLPRIAAALICGLIFGALHAITGISAVPPLIVFGFLLALLYEKTGSIVPGMLLHMLNNVVALASQ